MPLPVSPTTSARVLEEAGRELADNYRIMRRTGAGSLPYGVSLEQAEGVLARLAEAGDAGGLLAVALGRVRAPATRGTTTR